MADVVSKLARTVALHRRFSGPRIAEEVRWITADSTTGLIGAVEWKNRTYIRVHTVDTMAFFVEDDGELAGIADKELTCMAIGSLVRFPARPEAVLFVGVDNTDAI